MRRWIVLSLVVLAAAPAGAQASSAPRVHELIVFRSGAFREATVRARQVSVRVGRRRCVVGAGTPLGALLAGRLAAVRLHDYAHCSRQARDAGGLFVNKIGPDANAGQDGWVYKVGRRTGTAGAGDPSGPFGRGRLRSGAQLLWFYCHIRGSSCQRTLSLTNVDSRAGGVVVVHVKAYNDRGRGIPAAGVTVHVGSSMATTDASGVARVTAARGRRRAWADGGRYVRSFDTTVEVR